MSRVPWLTWPYKGKSRILSQRITLLDSRDDEGLIALAKPLVLSGVPTKVALVVLLEQNRDLLTPQIERLKPIIVEGFHGHL